jgi:hypothetical protein
VVFLIDFGGVFGIWMSIGAIVVLGSLLIVGLRLHVLLRGAIEGRIAQADLSEQLTEALERLDRIAATDDLTGWARTKHFPFHFAADGNKAVGKAYGASGILWHKRHLYVIDPQGRITYIARPFNQMSEDAYTALGAAVTAATR